jgi:glutamine synthetase
LTIINYSIKDDANKGFRNSHFLQVRYTDIFGRFHAKYLHTSKDQLHTVFRNGVGLDGSSVRGFANIDESDMLLLPDRKTLKKIAMGGLEISTAIADVYKGFNLGRSSKDPRHVTQRLEDHLALNQITCQIGAEVECFIFDDIEYSIKQRVNDVSNGKNDNYVFNDIIINSFEQFGRGKYPIRNKDGYDAPPFQDSLIGFRFEIANTLKQHYGIEATNLNHEVASSGQIEINFIHDYLTKSADNVQYYKDVVRNTAKSHSKIANFMPKPLYDEIDNKKSDNGSGMHVSVSLWKKKSTNSINLFYDENEKTAEISQTGRYFIGGILDHACSLAAIVTPTVNSYNRLIPGFEAPVYLAWASGNRSAVVRVPVNEKRSSKSKRVEFRAPDPSANPYLAFSATVAAGLDGIKRKIEPGDQTHKDIYKMKDSERKGLGIGTLPSNLYEALNALKSDCSYLEDCFNSELISTYLELKHEELKKLKNNSRFEQFLTYHDV